jgi:hypothetical protein
VLLLFVHAWRRTISRPRRAAVRRGSWLIPQEHAAYILAPWGGDQSVIAPLLALYLLTLLATEQASSIYHASSDKLKAGACTSVP